MKNSIFTLFFLGAYGIGAQVFFEGKAQTLDQINSPNGQNYLILDPNSEEMALTEERSGNAAQNDLVTYVDSAGAYVFNDWLEVKGMISPLGFENGDLLYNHVFYDKGKYYGLVMKLVKEGNNERVPVIIPFFKNSAPVQSGHLSASQEYMILSVESSDTYGVEDLYLSKRTADGGWSSLKNLGASLNSEYQEITPFLAVDNKTLFFASNRPGGAGSFDIYQSTRLDESWKNWSAPVPLTEQINTSGSETSFSFRDNETWAYFIRSEDSDGYGDVFRIKLREEIDADSVPLLSPDSLISQEEAQNNNDVIYLKVVSASTEEVLPAQFIISSDTVENINGRFTVGTLGGELSIKSTGFLTKVISLDSSLVVGENVIRLSSIAKGETVPLQNVLFRRGTAELVSGSEKELNLVVEVLNENPDIKILLKGHTDNTGDPVRNVKLSQERVKSVRAYIVSQGISPYRVSGKGFGGNQPIASNEREETRKLNRRVEFEVMED